MENIPIKLNQLVNEFHYFEDNQVLTANHLNEVIEFLDRRDRLTRTRLLGTGIVCGLQISQDAQSGQITISKGAAVTTDGDLLHLEEDRTFTSWKVFTDDKARYEPFHSDGSDTRPIPLFELFPDGTDESGLQALNRFTRGNRVMNNMVVVLYLNSYLEPPEDCTEIDCENKGPRQRAGLKVLLIERSQLDNLGLKRRDQYFDLPPVRIRRVDLSAGIVNDSDELLQRFNTAVERSRDALTDGLLQTCRIFPELLGPTYNGRLPEATWQQRLNTIFNDQLNPQLALATLRYDLMKDLAEAYEEFRETVLDLYVDCCPEPEQYPKHIMLREIAQADDCRPARYRHHFCEAPILNQKDRRVRKAQFLHQRINQMINGFRLTRLPNTPVRVTPSRLRHSGISDKAIPFYYQQGNRTNYTMHRFWNFELNMRCRESTQSTYHFDRLTDSSRPVNPLAFCHDDSDFYRVEGHLGKALNTALNDVQSLRRQFNLDFKIETIQIEDDLISIRIPPRFKFPQLENQLVNYREDLVDKMNLAKDFNLELANKVSIIENSDDGTFDNDRDLRTNLVSARSGTNALNQNIDQAKTMMFAKLDNFSTNYDQFRSVYQDAVGRANTINNQVYHATQSKVENPLQQMVLNNKLLKFDRLIDLLNRKKDKVRQQFVFDTFYNNNPGLEHLGGVPRGGTLVLVYSAVSNRVVADFSLPYESIIDADPEVEATPPDNVVSRPPIDILRPGNNFRWIDKLDIIRDPKIKLAVDRVNLIDREFNKRSENFYKDIVQIATVAKGRETVDTPNTPTLTNPFLENIRDRAGLVEALGGRDTVVSLLGGRQGVINLMGGADGMMRAVGGRGAIVEEIGGRNGLITLLGNRQGLVNALGGASGLTQAMGGASGILNAVGGRNGLINAMGGRNGMYQALGGRTELFNQLGGKSGILNVLGNQRGIMEFIGIRHFSDTQNINFLNDGRIRVRIDTPVVPVGGGGGRILRPSMHLPASGSAGNPTLESLQLFSRLMEQISQLEKPSKLDKDRQQELNKAFDHALSFALRGLTDLKEDIDVFSETAIYLQQLIELTTTLPEGTKLTQSRKTLKTLLTKHKRRIILHNFLDKLSL